MIDETGTVSEGAVQARLEFLRDEGLQVLAAYRRISEEAVRQSIVVMIEEVAGKPVNGNNPIVIEAADDAKSSRR